MRKFIQMFVLSALVLTSVTGAFAAEPAASSEQSAPATSAGVLNINTADASQFALLPRIGAKAGARIVDYRKSNGGAFKKASDLMQVKGVGEKTFELIRSYLVVDGKTTLSAKQHGPHKARSTRNKAAA